MSDKHLKEQVEAFTENSLLKLGNRVSGIAVFVIMLPLMSWLGIQMWEEQRDQGKANQAAVQQLSQKIDDTAGDLQQQIDAKSIELEKRLADLSKGQAVTGSQVLDVLRRLDRLELLQHDGSKALPKDTTSTASKNRD